MEEGSELIHRRPDCATCPENEAFFQEQVEQGLRDVAEGRTISHQELKERRAEWRRSAGR
jgi:predicted transcriptional regulator